jgi:hypothetical protein
MSTTSTHTTVDPALYNSAVSVFNVAIPTTYFGGRQTPGAWASDLFASLDASHTPSWYATIPADVVSILFEPDNQPTLASDGLQKTTPSSASKGNGEPSAVASGLAIGLGMGGLVFFTLLGGLGFWWWHRPRSRSATHRQQYNLVALREEHEAKERMGQSAPMVVACEGQGGYVPKPELDSSSPVHEHHCEPTVHELPIDEILPIRAPKINHGSGSAGGSDIISSAVVAANAVGPSRVEQLKAQRAAIIEERQRIEQLCRLRQEEDRIDRELEQLERHKP